MSTATNSFDGMLLRAVSEDITPLELWAVADYRGSLASALRIFTTRQSNKSKAHSASVIFMRSFDRLHRRIGSMNRNVTRGKDFEFIGWVNIRLEDVHKDEISFLAGQGETTVIDTLNCFARLAYDGYSLSVTWDDYSDSYQASIVCKAVDDANYGYGLSARHPDLDMALLTLRYKHENVCSGNWGSIAPSPKGQSWG